MKIKQYFFYAIGEILLIVIGVLLAMYINNKNIQQQYKNTIDNNLQRVYEELGKNIEKTKKTIKLFNYKDSLIHLVMNDSLVAEDYYANIDLAYLCLQNHQYQLEDAAYQNLIKLNVSDNQYQEELLTSLKELYSLNKKISAASKTMSTFLSSTSIPSLSERIQSFGDMTYRRVLEKDALDFFMKSKAYKNLVSRYAILAIRNQLDENRQFYKAACKVYQEISKAYNLSDQLTIKLTEQLATPYVGNYIYKNTNDTLTIKYENDSLFINRGRTRRSYLPCPLGRSVFLSRRFRTIELLYLVLQNRGSIQLADENPFII